jgi:hypothetical protein
MKESAKYLPILGVLRHPAAFSFRTPAVVLSCVTLSCPGWCWWFCEFIFLKRSWDKDKGNLKDGLSSVWCSQGSYALNPHSYVILASCEHGDDICGATYRTFHVPLIDG